MIEQMLIVSADDKYDKSGSTLCRAELELKIMSSSQKINLREKKARNNFLKSCFRI